MHPDKGSKPLYALTAAEAVSLTRNGTITVEALVRSCLERIADRDATIRAWVHIDPDRAIRHARELDKAWVKGPLHGLPIGVKDMIDTGDMPTQHNSPIYTGHQPAADAACIAILRASGALILGKTDTVEFAASGRKALTRNPYDLTRTPGGSSSGSGAAVADRHVPIALGTQTGGSLLRPASFCGVYGFKPTWGVINREGLRMNSPTNDTLGWYGRSIEDIELLCNAFRIEDDEPAPAFQIEGARIAVCRSPVWDNAEPATRQAMADAASILTKAGAQVTELILPEPFEGMADAHQTIMIGENRATFLPDYLSSYEKLHDDFRARVENRTGITRRQLVDAYDLAGRCRAAFGEAAARFDAILTPAVRGEATVGLASTGDSVFNKIWTLLHVPCIAVPGFRGPVGLPVGVQFVAPRFRDRHLLRVAAAAAEAFVAAGAAMPAPQ